MAKIIVRSIDMSHYWVVVRSNALISKTEVEASIIISIGPNVPKSSDNWGSRTKRENRKYNYYRLFEYTYRIWTPNLRFLSGFLQFAMLFLAWTFLIDAVQTSEKIFSIPGFQLLGRKLREPSCKPQSLFFLSPGGWAGHSYHNWCGFHFCGY